MTKFFLNDDGELAEDGVDDDGNHKKISRKDVRELTLVHCNPFNVMWGSTKFYTCAVVSVNGTLVEDKMLRFKGECLHFSFNKCLIYTHDGAKFSTNSHETDNSVIKTIPLFLTLDNFKSLKFAWRYSLLQSLWGRDGKVTYLREVWSWLILVFWLLSSESFLLSRFSRSRTFSLSD